MSDKTIFLKECPECNGKTTVLSITDRIHEECETCKGKGQVLNNALELVQEVIPKKVIEE